MLSVMLFALAQVNPPGFAQVVSLDARSVSGAQLADDLSRKTGIRFETLDEATADRFIVHIDKAPLDKVLERIAEAENGEWERRGPNEYRLRRSPAKIASLAQANRSEQIKQISAVLDGYRKQLEARPDFSDDAAQKLAREWRHLGPPPNGYYNGNYWERQNKLERAVPIGRAFMRVLVAFKPEDFADMPQGVRVVYSTDPTAMQRQLPDLAFQALDDLIAEQIVWEDAVSKYLPDQINQGWNGMATGGRVRTVKNAMVAFSRWSIGSSVQAQLILSDARGHIITETYLDLSQPYQAPSPSSPKPVAPPGLPPVPLSDTDTLLARIFITNGLDGRMRRPQLSDAIRAKLLDPERFDPLSTFVADGLIALAEQRHENFVGVIDEATIGAYAMAVGKKGMTQDALQYVRAYDGQNIDEGGGWMVFSEKRPSEADDVRCDRHALRVMVAAAVARGRLSLDDAAAYAISSRRFNENQIPMAYLNALLDKQGASTLQENDRNLLRLYGSLGLSCATGSDVKNLPMARLNAFQLGCIDRMLYGTNPNLQEETPTPMQPDENGEYYGLWNTVAREPTVSLGEGIPPSATLNITFSRGGVILAHMQYGEWDQGEQAYEPSSLGWMIASREAQGGADFGWNVLGMSAADRTQINFDFHYNDKIGQRMTLQDVLATSKETAFVEKLPDKLRKELQDAIAEARKQYAHGGGVQYYGGSGGGGAAPP